MALVLRKAVLPKNISLLKCMKGRPLATAANRTNASAISKPLSPKEQPNLNRSVATQFERQIPIEEEQAKTSKQLLNNAPSKYDNTNDEIEINRPCFKLHEASENNYQKKDVEDQVNDTPSDYECVSASHVGNWNRFSQNNEQNTHEVPVPNGFRLLFSSFTCQYYENEKSRPRASQFNACCCSCPHHQSQGQYPASFTHTCYAPSAAYNQTQWNRNPYFQYGYPAYPINSPNAWQNLQQQLLNSHYSQSVSPNTVDLRSHNYRTSSIPLPPNPHCPHRPHDPVRNKSSVAQPAQAAHAGNPVRELCPVCRSGKLLKEEESVHQCSNAQKTHILKAQAKTEAKCEPFPKPGPILPPDAVPKPGTFRKASAPKPNSIPKPAS